MPTKQDALFNVDPHASRPHANLSQAASDYLKALAISENDPDHDDILWLHTLAISYSPTYLAENADAIRSDWPRVPLPIDAATLRASAELGRRLASLVDPEQPVPGVTASPVAPHLKTIGTIQRFDGGALDPGAGHLAITAGWGVASRDGVTMPGSGRLDERPFTPPELATLGDASVELLGRRACDIYLNEHAFWRCVPTAVWEFKIGGYQVPRKWLSYREKRLLGRSLTDAEAREFTSIIRRLTAIVLLNPELDANYESVRGQATPLPKQTSG